MPDIPRWKYWLSHVTPLTLEEAASEHNPSLTVMLDQGRLQLLSGNAIYSWDDLYKNFAAAFEVIRPDQRLIEDVLLLGLGLGSVPYLLEKNYDTRYHYTAVEWDETIVELANRYTFTRLFSPVEIITADAEIFVEICEEQFDLLVVDIFEDNKTPAGFETPEFLEHCQRLIRPGGLIMYNRLSQSASDKLDTEHFYHGAFQTAFPGAQYVDTGGNWILWAETRSA